MIDKYAFLYHLVKVIPIKSRKKKKLSRLLDFYRHGNILVVSDMHNKNINPLKIPDWLYIETSLNTFDNKVYITKTSFNAGMLKLHFCDARNNTFKIGSNNNIHMNAQIRGQDGYAIIGNNNHICDVTLYMLCSGTTTLTIGNDNLFSEKIILWAGEGHSIINPETNKVSNLGGNIVIGNKNWICMNVCFLKRAKIGNGCIVGYGAIVCGDLSNEDRCVIAGNPANIVKHNILWANNSPWDYDGRLYI